MRQLRLESGLTQEEVAQRLDVSPRTIQNWERGVTQVGGDALPQVAAVFKVDASAFFVPREDFTQVCLKVRERYHLEHDDGQHNSFSALPKLPPVPSFQRDLFNVVAPLTDALHESAHSRKVNRGVPVPAAV